MQHFFQSSKDEVYFIVSTKFIQEWAEFCLSTETSRLAPRTMNYDIYENNQLKRGLTEKLDFEIVDEIIYNLFRPFSDETGLNKREAVFIG
jgi:hypothetical protein